VEGAQVAETWILRDLKSFPRLLQLADEASPSLGCLKTAYFAIISFQPDMSSNKYSRKCNTGAWSSEDDTIKRDRKAGSSL